MSARARLETSRRPLPILAAVLAAALALRLWGIFWGFPLLVNGDEPHLVNIAVSFGAGTLNPHDFKYPTLWMYVLSAAYGVYYLAWSLFGLRRTVAQFGGLFVWQTWRFHLIGRLLSALFSCLGVWVVAGADRENRRSSGDAWPWAAALLAVSPILVRSAHEAKADSLMFFLSALTWLFSLRTLRDGRERDALAAGLCAGLSLASQFTALPALMLPALALALRVLAGRETPGRALRLALSSGALAAFGFLIGCPYSVLDFAAFRAAMADHAAYAHAASAGAPAGLTAWANLLLIAGPWSLAALALPAGLARLWREDRARLALLAVPLLLWTAFLSRLHEGEHLRHLAVCFPAFALLAAEGFSAACGGRAALAAAAAALALLPAAWIDAGDDRAMTLPDTRLAATAWIEKNVPQGSALMMDQPEVSPGARMTREQAEELRQKDAAAGWARARYYALMRDSHPGGGWRVYRLKRSAVDLDTYPGQVTQTQKEGAFVDAGPGLSALRALGISYVVTSSYGASPERSPEFARFFAELSKEGRLLTRFDPDGRAVVGPALQIYIIPPAR